VNEIERHDLYKMVFDSPNGQLILKDLADRHRIFQTTFVTNDPYATAFNEGRRAVILDLIRFINHDLEFIKEVMKERHARERRSYTE
jgi:hypothetical protein